jgi:adenylosuccinate synthase
MKMHAVIGAQYGDEGKGLLTHHLSNESTLVVRFNGGAQAGHTVIADDGRRHVFHHVGAGAFRGAETLLSRFFLVNPVMYRPEAEDLIKLDVDPHVNVDHRALVSTPFDMILNQYAESSRYIKHGSCGLGINETVERSNSYPIPVSLLQTRYRLVDRLQEIRHKWMPTRCFKLGIPVPKTDGFIERFLEDVDYFLDSSRLVEDKEYIEDAERVVFEGAQGLRLDEYAPGYPHVTRSRTGMTNVMSLTSEEVNVHYVTRSYVTRHGAGPLGGELETPPPHWVDHTNLEHPWQGKIRFAELNSFDLWWFIKEDRRNHKFNSDLVITHCDQHNCDPRKVSMITEIPIFGLSYGPNSSDITEEIRSSS